MGFKTNEELRRPAGLVEEQPTTNEKQQDNNIVEVPIPTGVVDTVLQELAEKTEKEERAGAYEGVTATTPEREFRVKLNVYAAGTGRWQIVEETVKAYTAQMACAMVGSHYAAWKPLEVNGQPY